MQPFKQNETLRFGVPEGMKELSRGDETQEDKSLAEIQRHQRTERIKHKY